MRTKTRPAFLSRAEEDRQNRILDAKLAARDLERQQQLDAAIAEHQASLTPAQAQQAATELARLDSIATEESIRREERLRQRRTIDSFSTYGT
jgi:hypothetical protein